MKTAEEILGQSFYPHECGGMIECVTKQDALKAMEEYASQPMSAEQYSSGAIHSIGEFPTKSMSAEQVEEIKTVVENLMEQYRYAVDSENKHYGVKPFDWSKETELPSYESAKELLKKLSTAPTVKADGWVSVEDKLPEVLETVWVSNGKGWTTLGCRTDYYENDEGGFDWCWAGSNGIIYEESGKIVSECEEDDLDVRFWHPLPSPPTVNINPVEYGPPK